MNKKIVIFLISFLCLLFSCNVSQLNIEEDLETAASSPEFSIPGDETGQLDVQLSFNPGLTTDVSTGEGFYPLTEAFIDVKRGGEVKRNGPESFILLLKLDIKPDQLLVYHKRTGDLEVRPFLYDEVKGELKVVIAMDEDVSLLPGFLKFEETESEGYITAEPLEDSRAYFTSSSAKPFSITANNGAGIKVSLSPSYFRESTWWNFSFKFVVKKPDGSTLTSGSTSSTIDAVPATSGVYTFEISARYRFKKWYWFFGRHEYFTDYEEKVVWTQEINYEKYTLSEAARNSLARTYSPIIVNNHSEEYYPASLEYIFNNETPDPDIASESYKISDIYKAGSFYFRDIDYILPFYGHNKGLIDVSSQAAASGSDMRNRTNPSNPVVYYSFQERGSYYYIHYHFLYPFDPKTGTSASPAIGAHIFDRESVVVVLNKTSKTPVSVIYGAHLSSQSITYSSSSWANKLTYKNGRIKRAWASGTLVTHKENSSIKMDNDTLRAGTHPLVFLAHGAHAVYPYPGNYEVSLLNETAGMPSGSNYASGQVLFPPSVSGTGIKKYDLRDLKIGGITSYSFNKYLAFSGYMVDVAGTTNAKFPPFTDREKNPDSYYSGASSISWNWIEGSTNTKLKNLQSFIGGYVTVSDPLAPY